MSYQVLARKWRPRKFSELVGQEHVIRALSNALDGGRLHHAFLFTGTRGVGKTTIARIFAKSLNCERGQSSQPCGECRACLDIDAGRFVDLLEIDAASHTGVDDVREMIENAQYTPARGRQKVYLIDEVHMLSRNAFNALLKTLEEPPAHVKFLLATTDPQKLPVTVLSRCLKFNLKRLLPDQIDGQMRHILQAENIAFDTDAVAMLAKGADGSLRDGLSLLDQAIAYSGGAVRADEVRAMLGTIERAQVTRLLAAVVAGDGGALMAEVAKLAEFSPDFGMVLDDLAGLLHRVQLKQLVPDYATDDSADSQDIARFAGALAAEDVQLYYQLCITGRRDLPLAPTPRAGFEMALLRLLAFQPMSAGESGAPPAGSMPRPMTPTAGGGSPSGPSAAPVAPAAPVESREPSRPPGSAAAAAMQAVAALSGGSASVTERSAVAAPSPPPAVPKLVAEAPPVPVPARMPVAEPVLPQPTAAPATTAQVTTPVALEPGDWPMLIERAGLRGPVGQLAQHAALIALEGSVLRLALKAEHDHLHAPFMVAQLEERIGAVLGRTVKCQFEKARAGVETPADQLARQRTAQQTEAERAIDEDPFVQALVRDMGARVIPQSVRPLDAN
ncbi:DNA polymerase III subunit gamma/tau [Tahibacter amnicola]|uniref:DNA polymerase III subunit gamma/tau n=1 Tax=Tahibacter amnicola TaxID=2976241 RepID=A0ABY6BHZ8_9GAMM|nr:DNA polymerase III subunit gamma/tau [Tahibacter amnicola]UXI69633.1 DNA polymerase III subunit gamma/tau [Tahibacter amnicola]